VQVPDLAQMDINYFDAIDGSQTTSQLLVKTEVITSR